LIGHQSPLVGTVTWKKAVTVRRFEFEKHVLSSGFGELFFIEKHMDNAVILE
jgi:hypothetical protein